MKRYPLYVISKGRFENPLTANFLKKDKVSFKIVVEPQEFDSYCKTVDKENILVLPFSNLGLGSIPARNWVWEHAKSTGAFRHWILDDNIRQVRRFYRGKRISCSSNPAFAAIEDFTDRYENIAISGMNYTFFGGPGMNRGKPFNLNCHVYSCLLIRNDLSFRWRGKYNEDTDLCLQALSLGYCTTLINAFLIDKMATMTCKGGNTSDLYKGFGRLQMALALKHAWPDKVKVIELFGRSQHYVNWRIFTQKLKPKKTLNSTRDYGLRLIATKELKSDRLKQLLKSPSDSNQSQT